MVGDIEDHNHGKKVVVDGKTGQRRLPLVESAPAINEWLYDHPTGEKRDPLWCTLESPDQLSYHYIKQKLLPRAAKRARVDNQMNPHHFRHSRASELARNFKKAQLCEWVGRVQGSIVQGKYVHLSGKDVDSCHFKDQGLVEADEADQMKPCTRCEKSNEAGDTFCQRVARPWLLMALRKWRLFRKGA